MTLQCRTIIAVRLTPQPHYVLRVSRAEDPLAVIDLTIPIKTPIRNRQEASTAAVAEMRAISDGELAVLIVAHERPRN